MKTTNKTLNQLVIDEATNLKKNAKKKELANLQFKSLDTQNYQSCIYGQMTGDCFNERAIKLIEKSCERIFLDDEAIEGKITGTLNGCPKKERREKYWSPIEVFIDKKRNKNNGNNKRLIDFLKGKTKTLKLK